MTARLPRRADVANLCVLPSDLGFLRVECVLLRLHSIVVAYFDVVR